MFAGSEEELSQALGGVWRRRREGGPEGREDGLEECDGVCIITSSLLSSRLTFFSGGSSLSWDSRFAAGDSSFFDQRGNGPGNGIDGEGNSL